MTRRLFALGASSLAMVAVVYGVSCGDPSHIYEGRPFVTERACLGAPASIDVVEGDRPGDCGPTCLTQAQSDGGRAVYVGTMCGPYPFRFDASGADPDCPAALAALGRRDTCLSDGGSSHPAPAPADAGTD